MKFWPSNKIGDKVFDIYLSSSRISGGDVQDPDQSEEVKTVIKHFRKGKFKNLRNKSKIVDLGYGASWPLVLIEWFANAEFVNALANIGGVIEISEFFYNLFRSLKKRSTTVLRVGKAAARLLAVAFLSQKVTVSNPRNLKVLLEYELSREVVAEEKDFIFIISIKEEVYFIHVNWFGEVRKIHKVELLNTRRV